MVAVPLDLQMIRALVHLNNGEGRDALGSRLVSRLQALRAEDEPKPGVRGDFLN
jgi:hypothetical protein